MYRAYLFYYYYDVYDAYLKKKSIKKTSYIFGVIQIIYSLFYYNDKTNIYIYIL